MATVSLKGVSIENLRGYYSATLQFDRPRTLLVGPNNSGKTSILRLLNWVTNEIGDDLISQRRQLSVDEEQLLLPARDARHRARRFILHVNVSDARSWPKFRSDGYGNTSLRVNIRLTPLPTVYLALGNPRRGESVESDPNAIELLSRLRTAVKFLHIPSFRDAKSERFESTLQDALRTRIEASALHAAAAGAPKEHRIVAKNLEQAPCSNFEIG